MWNRLRISERGAPGVSALCCAIDRTVLLYAALCLCSVGSQAQVHDMLCNRGNSSFAADFRNRIRVSVGPVKNGALSTRTCQATIRWGQQSLEVATGAAQIDLDMFGVDLEGEGPVAAFQVRQQESDGCVAYKIYSLTDPPRLLRTIAGGEYFSGADTDLDGRVEIWVGDTKAVQGFERLSPGEVEFLPSYVLRFELGHLYDATGEFKPHFDDIIQTVRARIDLGLLRDFMVSDGKLLMRAGAPPEQIERFHRLRGIEIEVLEMVWAYLYTGRDDEAWRTLAEMWPKNDAPRIRQAIIEAKKRGIASQLDGPTPRERWIDVNPHKTAQVYDRSWATPPEAILMRLYPSLGTRDALTQAEVHVQLVIDSAGKVRSIKNSAHTRPLDDYVKNSAREWKFIPAFRSNRAVASRMETQISPQQ